MCLFHSVFTAVAESGGFVELSGFKQAPLGVNVAPSMFSVVLLL